MRDPVSPDEPKIHIQTSVVLPTEREIIKAAALFAARGNFYVSTGGYPIAIVRFKNSRGMLEDYRRIVGRGAILRGRWRATGHDVEHVYALLRDHLDETQRKRAEESIAYYDAPRQRGRPAIRGRSLTLRTGRRTRDQQ